MTSRTTAIGVCVIAPVLLSLAACGGGDERQDTAPRGPDRSRFEAITARGIAAVVDKHLGERVASYSVFTDSPDARKRTLAVRLRGADRRDSFLVSVYPEGGSEGEVAKGDCSDVGAAPDPQAKVTCTPAPEDGNVTITHLAFGVSSDNRRGRYVAATGSGPEEREASAEYESFTSKVPISDRELAALLGDPYLGWETDPKFNTAGEELKVRSAQG